MQREKVPTLYLLQHHKSDEGDTPGYFFPVLILSRPEEDKKCVNKVESYLPS